MKMMSILTSAAALSDGELLSRLVALAGKEREATVELLAHLAALDARPALYAAEGYGSLFRYCTEALRLSEDAACMRIEAARACGRFPTILDRLSCGSLTLTAVRRLGAHLTPENHERVLARAEGRGRHEIEALIAELAPRPDVPSSIRKLPTPSVPTSAVPLALPAGRTPSAPPGPVPAMAIGISRRMVEPLAPERYRIQFTVGGEAHQKLRRLQALLRREIPSGDAGAIVERALSLLLAEVERKKLGAAAVPRAPIRAGTDEAARKPASRTDETARKPASRYVPPAVRRAVWRRDGDQCAFVSAAGRRCQERTFLELHHVEPHARGGPATVSNLSVRCRTHNAHEAELVFGQRRAELVREGHTAPALQRMKL